MGRGRFRRKKYQEQDGSINQDHDSVNNHKFLSKSMHSIYRKS